MNSRYQYHASASATLAHYIRERFPRFCAAVAKMSVYLTIKESDLNTIYLEMDGEIFLEAPFHFSSNHRNPAITIERYRTDQELIDNLLPDLKRAVENYQIAKAI